MTYSLTRFAIYETVRDKITRENKGLMPFYQKVLLGTFGGMCPDSIWCISPQIPASMFY